MLQARANPAAQFTGPFLGLDLLRDTTQMGPRYARIARNVILDAGRVRPRKPWAHMVNDGRPVVFGEQVISMFPFSKGGDPVSGSGALDGWIVKTLGTTAGKLWLIDRNDFRPTFLGNTETISPADFVAWGGRVYVLDGSDHMTVTDGTAEGTIKAGIAVPSGMAGVAILPWADVMFGGGFGIGNIGNVLVSYKVTLWDDVHKVESNPVPTPPTGWSAVPVTQAVRFVFDTAQSSRTDGQGVTHWRIYRRNHNLFEVGWRLVAQVPTRQARFAFDDFLSDAQVDESGISSKVTGPFAPTRNGLVRNARIGAMYRGRMFFYRGDGERLEFSADGYPEYHDDLDFLRISAGPAHHIGGLIEHAGQLVVGKPGGIATVSGTIATATNDTNATGAVPLESTEIVDVKPARVGPTNSFGNGFVLAGEPAGIHFSTNDGLYRFDGVNVAKLSQIIDPLWHRSTKISGSQAQYAVVAGSGVLFIRLPFPDANEVLAYHWRTGAWTTMDGQGHNLMVVNTAPAEMSPLNRRLHLTCIASDGLTMILGDVHGAVLQEDETFYPIAQFNDVRAPMPDFEYVTGDMPFVRGLEGHVYSLKVFLGRMRAAVDQQPMIDLEVILDEARSVKGSFNMAWPDNVTLAVRRTGRTGRIRFAKGATWSNGYAPSFGLVGWEFNAELVGQR